LFIGKTPAPINYYNIAPVCLFESSENLGGKIGARVGVAGHQVSLKSSEIYAVLFCYFNITSKAGQTERYKKQGRMTVLTDNECKQTWPFIENHLQFCAGRPGEPQVCNGDSGGKYRAHFLSHHPF
jgi:hypothetical protein